MRPKRETLLCRYLYDPLDRLVNCTPTTLATTQRFYLKDRLATEIEGAVQRSIMQHDDQLLAQQHRQTGAMEARLFATDQQRSVLNVLDATRPHPLTYSPYGHRPAENGLISLLGFNGERPDPVTGCYLLGNGYRAFNPVLMRFNSPDSWSPFGEGGVNAYAYCVGNPINLADKNGHAAQILNIGSLFTKHFTKNKTMSRAPNQPSAIITLSGNMTNINPIKYGISSFTDNYKGTKRLNIIGHGTEKPINGYHRILAKEETLTPEQLYNTTIDAGIRIGDFKNIRLVMCYSANGGSSSFAQRFSDIAQAPVKGFINPVSIEPGVDRTTYFLQHQSNSLRAEPDGSFSYNKPMKIFKTNPYQRQTKERRTFSYQPLTFNPR